MGGPGQRPDHDGFVGRDVAYDCRQCITRHGERYGFPPLEPENEFAWSLFHELEDQVRVGMDVVGLDYSVLPVAFSIYRVPLEAQPLLFEKIVALNRLQQEHRQRSRAAESSRKAEAESQRVASGR